MTRDELENLIYERTRYFVDVPVSDCIFDLIAAEREACAKVAESFDPQMEFSNYGQCIANKIRTRSEV